MNEEHETLRTDILLDFDRAIGGLTEFESKVRSLAEHFEAVRRTVMNMEYDFTSKMQSEINKLSKGVNLNLVLDEKFLSQRLTAAIMGRVRQNGFDVNVKDFGKLQIDIDEKTWLQLRDDVKAKMDAALKEVGITDRKLPPMKFNLTQLKGVQSRLQSRLSEKLDRDLDFDFTGTETEGEKKLSIRFSPEHMQQIMATVNDRIVKQIQAGIGVEAGDLAVLPKESELLAQVAEVYRKIFQKIQNDLRQLASLDLTVLPQGVDLGQLRPNLENLASWLRQVNQLTRDLQGLGVGDQRRQMEGLIDQINQTVLAKTDQLFGNIIQEIQKTPEKKLSQKAFASLMGDFQNELANSIHVIVQTMTEQLRSYQKEGLEAAAQEVVSTAVRQITEQMVQVVETVSQSLVSQLLRQSDLLEGELRQALASLEKRQQEDLQLLRERLNQVYAQQVEDFTRVVESFVQVDSSLESTQLQDALGKMRERMNETFQILSDRLLRQIALDDEEMDRLFTEMAAWDTVGSIQMIRDALRNKVSEMSARMKEVAARIVEVEVSKGLGAGVANDLNRVVQAVQKKLQALRKQLEVSGIDTDTAEKAVSNVQSSIKKMVEQAARQTVAQIDEYLQSYQPDAAALNRAMGRVLRRVEKVALDGLKEVHQMLTPVDVGDFQEVYAAWQARFRAELEAVVNTSLQQILADMLLVHGAVVDALVDSIRSLAQQVRGAQVDFPAELLRSKVAAEAEELVRQMVAQIRFTEVETAALTVPFSSQVVEEALQQLDRVIRQHVNRLLAELDRGTAMAKELRVEEGLGEQIRTAAQRVLDRVIQEIQDRLAEVQAAVLMMDLSKDREQSASKLENAARTVLRTVSDRVAEIVLETAAAFAVTEEMRMLLQERLKQALNRAIRAAEFSFAPLTVNLTEAAQSAIRKVEREVQQAVREWVPEVPAEIGMSEKTLGYLARRMQALTNRLGRQATDAVHKQLGEEMEAFLKSEKYVFDAAKVLERVSRAMNNAVTRYTEQILAGLREAQPMIRVRPQDLHPGVRQELARQQEQSVKEFVQNHPFLEGQDMLFRILRENMAYIFDQFHKRMQKNSVAVIRDYQKALELVQVEPDHTVVEYFTEKLQQLQAEVVRKVKQILNEQFLAIRQEVQKLALAPISMGPLPSVPGVRKAMGSVEQAVAVPAYYPRSVNRTPSSSFRVQDRGYFPTDMTGRSGVVPIAPIDPGGSTRNFASSVVNTIRYITAGAAVWAPFYLYYSAWQSAREFDYQLEKARQNFIIKDPTMRSVAEERVRLRAENADQLGELGIPQDVYQNERLREQLIQQEIADLQRMTRDGVVRPLQEIALINAINPAEVSKAFQIASRTIDDPYEALAFTNAVAKVRTIEEVDVEEAAKGFESVMTQWQISGESMDQVANMMIKAANITNATVEDLLDAQSKTGALFMQNLPGMTKEEALATSIGLQSIFVQATARSGSEAGTFWKALLTTPFRPETLNKLEEMSKYPGMENLYPFVTNEQGVVEQKPITDVLFDVFDVAMRLDDERRRALLRDISTQWQIGDLAAIEGFITAMDEDLRRVGTIMKQMDGVGAGFREFVKAIQNASPEEVAVMRAGMMNTYDFMVNRIGTQWQVATQGLFEEFKDEFSNVMSYLSAYLRLVQEHSGRIAEVIELLTQVAVAMGLRFVTSKASQALQNRALRQAAEAVDTNRYWLQEEGRVRNLQRIALEDQLAYYQGRYREIDRKRLEAAQRVQEAEDRLLQVTEKQRVNVAKQQALLLAGLGENTPEYKKLQREYAGLEQARLGLLPDVFSARKEMNAYQNQLKRMGLFIEELQSQGIAWARGAKNLNARMEMLDLAAEDLGVGGKGQQKMTPVPIPAEWDFGEDMGLGKVRTQIDDLGRAMQSTSLVALGGGPLQSVAAGVQEVGRQSQMAAQAVERLSVSEQVLGQELRDMDQTMRRGKKTTHDYVQEILQMDRRMSMSDDDVRRLRMELDQLHKEMESGKITYSQYIRRVQELERMHRTGMAGLPGGGLGSNAAPSPFGNQLLTMIALGSLFGSQMVQGPRGIRGRVQDVRETGNPLAWFNYWRPMRTETGEVMRTANNKRGYTTIREFGEIAQGRLPVGGAGGLVRNLGRGLLTRVGPWAGWFLAADALGAVFDAVTSRAMTDAERMQLEANRLEELMNVGLSSAEKGFGSKMLTTLLTGVAQAPGDIMSNLLGGTGPGFADYGKMLWAMWWGDTEALEEMRQQAQDQATQARMQMQREQEEALNRNRLRLDDLQQMTTREIQDRLNVVDVSEVLADLSKKLQRDMANLTAEYTIDKNDMLIKGFREDSEQIRELTDQFLSGQIELLTKNIDALQKLYDSIGNPESEDALEVQSQKLQLEMQRSNLQREQIVLRTIGALESISQNLDRAVTRIQANSGIQQNELLLRGMRENSPELRRQRIVAINQEIKQYNDAINEYLELIKDNQNNSSFVETAQAEILKLRSQISELQLERYQLETQAALNYQMSELDRTRSMLEARFGIRRAEALLGGASEESAEVRQIDASLVYQVNRAIEQAQAQLKEMQKKFDKSSAIWQDLQLQILQLEQEQKDNLVRLREELKVTMDTFNLPPDIRPLTYWEAMTRGNTNASMTIRAGDVIVNMMVGEMPASQSEINRLGRAVARTVADAQPQLTRQLWYQVRTGMGNNYLP